MVNLPRFHDDLFERLRRIARLGLPAATLAFAGCECPTDDRLFLLRDPDAETLALIDACRRSQTQCLPLCQSLIVKHPSGRPEGIQHCELHETREGYVQVHVGLHQHCPGGRRPEGVAFACAAGPAVAAALAGLAQLEAASVPAFDRLAAELAAHDAPAALAAASRSAVHEERRHAALVAALARRAGMNPGVPTVPTPADRTLEALAIDNAVEGCVRETWGALVATRQAITASDPLLRHAFAVIARDEASHAALSMALDAWVGDRLPAPAQRRVRDARRAAWRELAGEAATLELPAEARATLGLADPTTSRRLMATLEGIA